MAYDNDFDPTESFQNELNEYLTEYNKIIFTKYTRPTASKHYCVIQDFIDYVTLYESCSDLSMITKAMTASKLAKNINSQGDDHYSTITVKNIVEAFLKFIYEKYGIRNPKLTP